MTSGKVIGLSVTPIIFVVDLAQWYEIVSVFTDEDEDLLLSSQAEMGAYFFILYWKKGKLRQQGLEHGGKLTKGETRQYGLIETDYSPLCHVLHKQYWVQLYLQLMK